MSTAHGQGCPELFEDQPRELQIEIFHDPGYNQYQVRCVGFEAKPPELIGPNVDDYTVSHNWTDVMDLPTEDGSCRVYNGAATNATCLPENAKIACSKSRYINPPTFSCSSGGALLFGVGSSIDCRHILCNIHVGQETPRTR